MSIECPYCGAELIYEDTYGIGNQSAQEKYGYGWNKLGTIYRCPNHEGFENEEGAIEYMNKNDATFESWSVGCWEEIVCESSCHRVSGSFYDDDRGNLHEGYPC